MWKKSKLWCLKRSKVIVEYLKESHGVVLFTFLHCIYCIYPILSHLRYNWCHNLQNILRFITCLPRRTESTSFWEFPFQKCTSLRKQAAVQKHKEQTVADEWLAERERERERERSGEWGKRRREREERGRKNTFGAKRRWWSRFLSPKNSQIDPVSR